MGRRFHFCLWLAAALCVVSLLTAAVAGGATGPIRISPDRRFFQLPDGAPFFWLGDTAWFLLHRLNREETERYLADRADKGFNVIQVTVLGNVQSRNLHYGVPALLEGDPAKPNVTPGADPAKPGEYDYWDHLDWVLDRAAGRGIHLGLVVAWGSMVNRGHLHEGNVESYARFLARRYRGRPNIVWILGGDTYGDRRPEVWRALGRTLKQEDPDHLITFHPFGRTQSSSWFHQEPWLDFNMFQSGHRRYDQDDTPSRRGEDNWRYVVEDYAKQPPKPTLDGEPSYEDIPQGLHDPSQPYWTANDCRRYAYWSVFAGACGHTYGHNAVMQMHRPGVGKGAYGVRKYWYEALDDPGARHMRHLKQLVLSRPYFERVFDPGAVADNGERYQFVIAMRGKQYLMAYTYVGRTFRLRMGRIHGSSVRAWWYDPRTGAAAEIAVLPNRGEREFDPPGDPAPGNDWVLVLDDASAGFPPPGRTEGEGKP
ncbi:MAG: glycoside hydrolase family 140 protein [Bryobacterales bacterium]|nr:glycoside hydrolase family 140 protein [Bryobacterales bacterium]